MDKSLIDYLKQIPDPRDPHGRSLLCGWCF